MSSSGNFFAPCNIVDGFWKTTDTPGQGDSAVFPVIRSGWTLPRSTYLQQRKQGDSVAIPLKEGTYL